MDAVATIRAALALAIIAWLPGFAWSHALLPGLTRIERLVVSIVLSLALVALALFVAGVLFGARVNGTLAMALAIGLAALGALPALRRAVARIKRPG